MACLSWHVDCAYGEITVHGICRVCGQVETQMTRKEDTMKTIETVLDIGITVIIVGLPCLCLAWIIAGFITM